MKPYYKTTRGALYKGDCKKVLKKLPDESVQCIITSPPYWKLRDYGDAGQLGLEKTIKKYISNLVNIFQEAKRVLKKDGTVWLNIGDKYIGDKQAKANNLKTKDLCGLPWRLAFALQKDGWYLRQDIIWHKINPTPEPTKDRCTKAHEYLFLLSKSKKYYYNREPIREPVKATTGKAFGAPKFGKHRIKGNYQIATSKTYKKIKGANKRSVWSIPKGNYKGAHFATFPPDLIIPCVLAGSKAGQVILDPLSGTNTVGLVCEKYKREWIAIELSKEYCDLSIKRIKTEEVIARDKSILRFLKTNKRKIKRRSQNG